MGIIYGAFADEYAESLEDQIKGLLLNNMRNLEVRFIDGVNIANFDNGVINKVYNTLYKNGINVFAIGSPIGKISICDNFDEHLKVFERICNTAKQFRTKYIRMFSFYNKLGLLEHEFREHTLKRIEVLLNIADKYELTLCHENEEGIYGESPEKCKDLLDYFGGRLKCVFDMGNFILKGYDPINAYELLYNYIEYFHIKDGTPDGKIAVPGYGKAKIKEIIKDYDSKHDVTYVTLEPHLMGFVGLNSLTESKIKQEVSFTSNQEAFNFAAKSLREILS